MSDVEFTDHCRAHWVIANYNREAYRIASVIVNLTIEMGLNERPSEMTQHQILLQKSSLSLGQAPFANNGSNHELKRVLAGAYQVSIA
jgi:hypothetical protein